MERLKGSMSIEEFIKTLDWRTRLLILIYKVELKFRRMKDKVLLWYIRTTH